MSKVNCSSCGKFMKFDGVTINPDNSYSKWICACGKTKEEQTSYGQLFHRDAIGLVQYNPKFTW